MLTVADVLKRIERIKKDLEYVKSFQEKWRDQRERFPKIYEGILEQERSFLARIDELRNLGVSAGDLADSGAIDAPAAAHDPRLTDPRSASGPNPVVEEGTRPQLVPNIEASGNGRRRRGDSSDDARVAAAEGIGEKLRARQGSTGPAK